MADNVFLFLSDNRIEIDQLLDKSVTPAAVVTSATCEVTLLDKAGVEIVGQTWPTSMPHVAAGLYRGFIDDTITVTKKDRVDAVITADDGAGRRRRWRERVAIVEG